MQTSRPAPAAFLDCYRAALDAGASAVVSVHLSRELSGTWEAARLAAEEIGADRVRVVDSRAACMGLGYAVLAAADAADGGGRDRRGRGRGDGGRERAAACSSRSTPWNGCAGAGGSGAAAAWVGTALAVKPLLHVAQGRIVPLEKVRTTARAAQRLVELAVQAAGEGPVDVAVHHLAAAARAEEVAARLRERLRRRAAAGVGGGGRDRRARRTGLLGVVVVPRTRARPRRAAVTLGRSPWSCPHRRRLSTGS